MENDMDNTVENTQDDNNAIKAMRERIKELEGVEKEYKSVQMGNAIKDAGFDPNSGQGKALKDLYKGELNPDSIKQFAVDNYGWGSETPTEESPQDAQRSRVITSQESLDLYFCKTCNSTTSSCSTTCWCKFRFFLCF